MRRSKATSTPDRAILSSARPPQYTFVGGKGGVGKTTCAAALGMLAARQGFETLLISTDPAPSLADALQQPLGVRPRTVRGTRRLHAVEVNGQSALMAYLAKRRPIFEEIALRGTWLDKEDVSRLLGLSLPGIDEVAALLQIAGFSRNPRYDRIIVDTAPTGHLLRMLEMPLVLQGLAQVFDHMQAKHRVMVDALRGEWTPDSADALIVDISRDAEDLKALFRDPTRAQLLWVTLPEPMSIEESADALQWLRDSGIHVDTIVVNRVTQPPPDPCRWCDARRRHEQRTMRVVRGTIAAGLRLIEVPAVAREPRGLKALNRIGNLLEDSRRSAAVPVRRAQAIVRAALPKDFGTTRHAAMVTDEARLVMFGGKGGVGKTTCAAAAALEAARAAPRRRVLLLSTDPAHSIGDALGQQFSDAPERIRRGPPNLAVRELDAARAFAAVRDRFASGIEELFARVSGGNAEGSLARHDRQVMRDLMDLAPPGVDELVAIIEVTESLAGARSGNNHPDRQSAAGRIERGRQANPASPYDLVVMDTAPTGHALRLIEMPGLVHEWVKALMAILLKYQPIVGVGDLGAVLLRLSQGLGRLRETMNDRARTRFIAVTRPAALPRAETVRLLARLHAASVSVPAIIINAVGAGTCRRCRADAVAQGREIRTLRRALPKPARRRPIVVVAAAELPPPHGQKRLREWRETWRELRAPPSS